MLYCFIVRRKLALIRRRQAHFLYLTEFIFSLRRFATFAVKCVLSTIFMSHAHFNLLKPLNTRQAHDFLDY